jgi:hypothetical protein
MRLLSPLVLSPLKAKSFQRKHDASRTYYVPPSENPLLLRCWMNLRRVLRLLMLTALTPKLARGHCLEECQPAQQQR